MMSHDSANRPGIQRFPGGSVATGDEIAHPEQQASILERCRRSVTVANHARIAVPPGVVKAIQIGLEDRRIKLLKINAFGTKGDTARAEEVGQVQADLAMADI